MHKITHIVFFILASFLFSACGNDYMPVYFPPQEEEVSEPPLDDIAIDVDCTVSFTSQLCVILAGDNDLSVGTDPDNPLCKEISPFPIHISGREVSMIGSEFPDIEFEGQGLPAPITINGRGDGTGDSNIGSGPIDSDGDITIENFSFFIDILGMVGEVTGINLTTAATDELPHLEPIEGSPPDISGAMTLVGGTVIGHLFDAADRTLMGASLQVKFFGAISPTLDECSDNSGPSAIEIKKIFLDENGNQSEEPLPEENRMEISSGTFIAQDPSDIGPKFEASAKFKVKNISSKPVDIKIPSAVGPFVISSLDSLTTTLNQQQSIIIDATFRPTTTNTTEEGEIIIPLIVGSDPFKLVATAKQKSGSLSLSSISESGDPEDADINDIDMGEIELPANSEKDFFQCNEIECNGNTAQTNCVPCEEESNPSCRLMVISTSGKPVGEVDANCNLIEEEASPKMTIDLRGIVDISSNKEIITVRNKGTRDITITEIRLEELPNSQSTGQFSLRQDAIYLTDNFIEIDNLDPVSLPVTLPPFEPGHNERALYIVVTYQPTDLIGSDGTRAGVGSSVKDKVVLQVIADGEEHSLEISAETAIMNVPELELYFKTSTGIRKIENGKTFPFREITAETVDSAVPLFLKLSDSSSKAMRIISISIEGEDESFFQWLDATEEISAVSPPTGRGKRCSIPILDPTTNEMTNEIFDLNPVAIGATGFDLEPGAHSIETMPLFGCVNFHRNIDALSDEDLRKRSFKSQIVVSAQELDLSGNPVRNPDGSYIQAELRINLVATINPLSGKLVLRISQTSSLILNPQSPGISAIAALYENQLIGGDAAESNEVFLSALILDPFDEMAIYDSSGQEVLTTPNDGITGVFRPVDTHPVDTNYEDSLLFDYASLIYDSSLPEGMRGAFEGFPNVPDGLKSNGWRIFTSTFSYPGPVGPEEKKPKTVKDCLIVKPCSEEGLRKFTDAGVHEGEKGACAFFYTSGGRFDSPAFHEEYKHLCEAQNQKQNLLEVNAGHYSLDGSVTFEDLGMRFFGPTYFHNPGGPVGAVPPMDAILHLSFTTDTLKPPASENDPNLLPDEKIDLANNGYKINLTDPVPMPPAICATNTKNRVIDGREYSTWKYMAPLLSKDENGDIPAGCPEENNDLTGGFAYLHGRKVNQETGIVTFVAAANFGPDENLTFVFKDVMIFFAITGWVCNPMGSEEDFEGARCYDASFNERDARSQISIIGE